jgi:Mg-chelatase subunit ChlD
MDDKNKGIRIVKKPGDGVAMITGGTEINTQGTINIQFESRRGMVYILVDCSGSMAGSKISQVKEGIMQFDTSATLLCEPKYDVGDLKAYLDKMHASGSTNMTAAISMAHKYLGDVKYTRVIVIATDGQPDNKQSAIQAGQNAKNDGIDIITIGTDDADQAFLKKLATSQELGNKVPNEQFGKALASAHLLLPDPRKIVRK